MEDAFQVNTILFYIHFPSLTIRFLLLEENVSIVIINYLCCLVNKAGRRIFSLVCMVVRSKSSTLVISTLACFRKTVVSGLL